jgi:hypothetical protein
MPFNAPQFLSINEVYSLSAYILSLNKCVTLRGPLNELSRNKQPYDPA